MLQVAFVNSGVSKFVSPKRLTRPSAWSGLTIYAIALSRGTAMALMSTHLVAFLLESCPIYTYQYIHTDHPELR